MAKAKKKHVPPVSKKKSAEYLMAQISASVVIGKSKKIKEKERKGFHFEDEEKPNFKIEKFRSDGGKEKIKSEDSRKGKAVKCDNNQYTGESKLAVGLGYNKGGLQVLSEKEIRDSGKKTSQLE